MQSLGQGAPKGIRRVLKGFRKDSRANVLFEFAIALPFLVLMVVGTFAVGLMFDRHLTQGQLARNAANMFARGVHFNTTANKQLLANAGTGMNLQVDGSGDTIVYLTALTRVPSNANCLVSGSTVPCANRGMVVMAQRFVVGNTSVGASVFGDPGSQNIDSKGNVLNYENETYARATVPSSISNTTNGIGEGEFTYAADTRHNPTLIKFPGIVAPEQMHTWAYY